MLKAENIRYLVVHCADTPDDQNLGARDIHQMHLAFGCMGWAIIGWFAVMGGSNMAVLITGLVPMSKALMR